MIHVLCRHIRRNLLLVGEPGLRIRSLIEALAARIAEGKVPVLLEQKKIIAVDMPFLASESNDWADFQYRLSSFLREAAELRDVILLIDDLPGLFLGGASESSPTPATNKLKAALLMGQLQCIGTTTPLGYRKLIGTDLSLGHYFQRFEIPPAINSECIQLLSGVKHEWEVFHSVVYAEDALQKAVALAERDVTDELLLERAARLLDEAGMRVKLGLSTRLRDFFDLQRRIESNAASKKKAMTNHDFERARIHEDEERKARENLLRLKEQHRIQDLDLACVCRDDIEEAWHSLKNAVSCFSPTTTGSEPARVDC